MGFLATGAVLNDTDRLSFSCWFRIGGPFQNLFRCADGPSLGTTLFAYSAGLIGIDIRDHVIGQFSRSLSGIPLSVDTWYHIFFSFLTSSTSSTFHAAQNGIIYNSTHGCGTIADGRAYCPLSGYSIGIPVGPIGDSSIDSQPKIKLAQYQLWIGQFIPVTPENLAVFVTINNNIGQPNNYLLAQTAFGTPAFSLVGSASNNSFDVNHGTAGGLTRIGTESDFIPSASYGP